MTVRANRLPLFLLGITMLVAVLGAPFASRNASAAQITNRSLTLQAGATDGGSKPGGVVKHLFTFDVVSTTDLGSIKFQYCTTASGTCDLPTDLVTTTATLGSEAGANTGFVTVDASVNGTVYIARLAAATGVVGANTYQLAGITNPSATNTSFFVRISTHTALDASDAAIDTGVVTASTATQIVLTGTMPESLIFCTGQTIGTTSGIPDCSTATPGLVDFDQLFSPTDTATATSQLAASTNGTTGYSITVTGPTLTSGGNTIPALSAADTSKKGVGQFGMNLRSNTVSNPITTNVGDDIAPASDGAFLKGNPLAGYNTIDTFKFDPAGNAIADSANGGTGGPTNAQIYTASYIVNVAGSQVAATYTTTLTYVCTATF